MRKMQEIMLRRKQLVLLNELDGVTDNILNVNDKNGYMEFMTEDMKRTVICATVAHNMSYLGYVPSQDLLSRMMADEKVSEQINAQIIPILKELKGADVQYNPMYKNFPKEVMDMDEAELYINAIVHYISKGTWMPESLKIERAPINERVQLRTIGIGEDIDCQNLFRNMLNSATPYSEQDFEDIEFMSKTYSINEHVPKFIVSRENMTALLLMQYKKAKDKQEKANVIRSFKPQFRTATDVLRIMNVLHGNGDASLSGKTKISRVPQAERRVFLEFINDIPDSIKDMKARRGLWKAIDRTLHPSSEGHIHRYPNANKYFEILRNNKELQQVKTDNAIAEIATSGKDKELLASFASEKPGMLARSLDKVIRNADDKDFVLSVWNEQAKNVAPALLWTVYAYFKKRCDEYGEKKLRSFVTKSKSSFSEKTIDSKATSHTFVQEDTTKEIDKAYYQRIMDITKNALKEIYKEKPPMGKVYIDPEIEECKVPKKSRDASAMTSPMESESRLKINDNANIVRPFIWWTNTRDKHGRVDIDLSAALLDKDLKLVDRCSYYNLKGIGFSHSGDIINGGNFDGKGVAEFIDIDLNAMKERDVKYVCFTVHSFSNQNYSEMEHVRFGYMEREKEMSGEIFEPSTVKQSIKFSAVSTDDIVCMIDVDNKKMIWMDEVGQDVMSRNRVMNNMDETWRGTSMVCYKAVHSHKPNIGDLIRANVEARGGEIVYDKKDADLIFALNEGIQPTDFAYFSGELMPKESSVQQPQMPNNEKQQPIKKQAIVPEER